MRLAIVSDTHLPRGQRRLPERCVAEIRAADLVLHAGDLISVAFLDELEAIGPPVVAVLGNVDEPALAGRVPAERVVAVEDARIAMLHDAGPSRGRATRMQARFPDAHAVVFGHSHIPLHARGRDGFQLFNPGSPTDKRTQPRFTMGVAEVAGHVVRFDHLDVGET
jgi:hypothetical protein